MVNGTVFKALKKVNATQRFADFWDAGFKYAPIVLVTLAWHSIQSERFSSLNRI